MKRIDPDFQHYLEILAAVVLLAGFAMALGYAGPPADMGTQRSAVSEKNKEQ